MEEYYNAPKFEGDVNDEKAVFEFLHEYAVKAAKNTYSPYSHYPVGAAALTETGEVVAGCNVENGSYGLTLCAECCLVSTLKLYGYKKIHYFVCVNKDGDYIAPCGRCRQLLYEHGEKGYTKFFVKGEVYDIDSLLPAMWDFD